MEQKQSVPLAKLRRPGEKIGLQRRKVTSLPHRPLSTSFDFTKKAPLVAGKISGLNASCSVLEVGPYEDLFAQTFPEYSSSSDEDDGKVENKRAKLKLKVSSPVSPSARTNDITHMSPPLSNSSPALSPLTDAHASFLSNDVSQIIQNMKTGKFPEMSEELSKESSSEDELLDDQTFPEFTDVPLTPRTLSPPTPGQQKHITLTTPSTPASIGASSSSPTAGQQKYINLTIPSPPTSIGASPVSSPTSKLALGDPPSSAADIPGETRLETQGSSKTILRKISYTKAQPDIVGHQGQEPRASHDIQSNVPIPPVISVQRESTFDKTDTETSEADRHVHDLKEGPNSQCDDDLSEGSLEKSGRRGTFSKDDEKLADALLKARATITKSGSALAEGAVMNTSVSSEDDDKAFRGSGTYRIRQALSPSAKSPYGSDSGTKAFDYSAYKSANLINHDNTKTDVKYKYRSIRTMYGSQASKENRKAEDEPETDIARSTNRSPQVRKVNSAGVLQNANSAAEKPTSKLSVLYNQRRSSQQLPGAEATRKFGFQSSSAQNLRLGQGSRQGSGIQRPTSMYGGRAPGSNTVASRPRPESADWSQGVGDNMQTIPKDVDNMNRGYGGVRKGDTFTKYDKSTTQSRLRSKLEPGSTNSRLPTNRPKSYIDGGHTRLQVPKTATNNFGLKRSGTFEKVSDGSHNTPGATPWIQRPVIPTPSDEDLTFQRHK